MMHRADKAEPAEKEFEEPTPRKPDVQGAFQKARPTQRRPGDISPTLTLGQHDGKSFESATEADPQYWGASRPRPGIFLRSYLDWVRIHYIVWSWGLAKRTSGKQCLALLPHATLR